MPAHSPYASPRATMHRLAEWGIHTKKSLGQHFLVDDGVVGRILKLAELHADKQVLEIGPGIGTLTEAMLLKSAHVMAIEKDARLLPLLEDMRARYPNQFDFVCADALDYITALAALQPPQSELPNTLISNLPYAVAATLVLDFFQGMPQLESATVMVQKEVADRMAAKPGSKNYGAYSVKLQLIAEPISSFKVAPSCFLPPPRVDSTVIRLDRRHDVVLGQNVMDDTFLVIEAAFAKRRKTIRNSMRSQFEKRGLALDLVDQLLKATDTSPNIRGEVLEPDEFLQLGTFYSQMRAAVTCP